ncbi:MAG: hypothetical protein OXK76_05505 [Gammaproteobacteria bacterium]|nr:hypothetical protein [Gammaproteobacteria bacterium]
MTDKLPDGQARRVACIPCLASLSLLAAVALAGCSSLRVPPLPEPLRAPATVAETDPMDLPGESGEERTGLTVTPVPGVPVGPGIAEGTVDRLGADLAGDPIAVAFNNAPLPAFIDELFNELLGLSYHIAPDLQEKTDLVTLRISDPMTPAQVFATARRILEESYGVRIREEDDGTLTFVAAEEVTTGGVPLLISGRTRPEVPATQRVIFQIVVMKAVRPVEMVSLLNPLLRGLDLEVEDMPGFNAVRLKGKLALVDRAVAMIEVLDQPILSSRNAVVIEPVFLDVGEMASELIELLAAQGYTANIGRDDLGAAVILLPLTTANKLVVFAVEPEVLDRVVDWASVVDARREASVEDGWFHYEFRNTQAEELIATLNEIMSAEAATRSATSGGQAQQSARKLVFIKSTNTVLYRGNGKDWSRIRAFIDQLDRPVPQVLIEVVLAEVTLTGKEESGIQYLVNAGVGNRDVDIRLAPSGVTLTLDGAGQTRALLTLAYEDTRVAIRSRPWLVAKSGQAANIFGGSQVPVISQRAEGPQSEGSASVVQQISYRDTGVTLNITPIVQANGLVDLTIQQSLSEQRATGAASLTPTILTRQLSTSLTLRDGQSLLMGGLISEGQNQGRSGVPGLAQLPVVGRLFSADSYQKDRTELVVMVIPYVIADHRQGRELTDQIRSQLELHRRFL